MSRMVKDYIEVGEHVSLDALIDRLTALRDSLPDGAETELQVRGDDVFGRHLCIGFLRAQTAEEIEVEERYAAVTRQAQDDETPCMQDQLGYCALPRRKDLRAAA
jgi:hypothetical protein